MYVDIFERSNFGITVIIADTIDISNKIKNILPFRAQTSIPNTSYIISARTN